MKTTETKNRFIELRAAGLSYDKISKDLSISKSTCSKWSDELGEQINRLKQQQLNDLYSEYGMLKEQRIKSLGVILQKIDNQLADVDFSDMTPTQLLDAKLKYQKALNTEYIPKGPVKKPTMTYVRDRYLEVANKARAEGNTKLELQALQAVEASPETKEPLSSSLNNLLDF